MKNARFFDNCRSGNQAVFSQRWRPVGYGLLLSLFCTIYYCADIAVPGGPQLDLTVISGDSTVGVHDSLVVSFSSGAATSRNVRYVWFVDSPLSADTTFDNLIVRKFSIRDTGMRLVVIKAVDSRGAESVPESLFVMVRYYRPVVSVTGDTLAHAGIPYSFTISSSSTVADSRIVRYEWYRDDPRTSRSTFDSVVAVPWLLADTGRHAVVVRAVDENGVSSYPDTLTVTVRYHRPVVSVTGDTLAYAGAPYSFKISSVVAGSLTVRYEWYRDDPRTGRSTIDSVVAVPWLLADTGRHAIVVRAVDENGVSSYPDTLTVTVRYLRPYLLPLADTSVKVNTTLALRFRAGDPVTGIAGYRYCIDDSTGCITTADSVAAMQWQVADSGAHRITVRAVNRDGMASLPETLTVTVTASHPAVTLSAAASVAVNDTIPLTAQAVDPDGTVLQYRWSIDNGFWFATDSARVYWTFGNSAAAAGDHTVRVVAVDDDGLLSDTAGVRVFVALKRPAADIRGPADTAVYANIPIIIKASVFDTNGTVTAYHWALDGRPVAGSMKNDSVTLRWSVAETGVHLVTLTVADNDSMTSHPDTMRIVVLPGVPSVTAMHDTIVSSYDTLRLTCSASDTNGTIDRYLWDYSGNGWDDSTGTPQYPLVYAGSGTVRVIAGVRDNDGLIAADTVVVKYNRPPGAVTVVRPGASDTLRYTPTAARCTVSFVYNAPDPDSDSVTYTLFWGLSAPDSLVEIYKGNSTSANAVASSPGRYFWRLVARDSWGHSCVKTGQVVVLREYRICFAGHSVVAGLFGDGMSGGFRGGVLDSLRKTLGAYERLKAVGPHATGYLRRSPVDDSCLAIISATAREMYLLLTYSHTSLFADIWVLMIGVNDSYGPNEQAYTVKLMQSMVSRNPASRLYTVNGYQLPASYYMHNYYRPYFNQVLADSAAAMKARGAQVSVIDSYTLLSTTDGLFNPVWFTDDVHPNQSGYARLANSIYSAMKNSSPPALPPKP